MLLLMDPTHLGFKISVYCVKHMFIYKSEHGGGQHSMVVTYIQGRGREREIEKERKRERKKRGKKRNGKRARNREREREGGGGGRGEIKKEIE